MKLLSLFLTLALLVKNNQAVTLTQDVLLNEYGYSLNTTIMYLNGKNISRIEDGTFENFTRLEVLYLKKNCLVSIINSPFKNLTSIQEISFEENNLNFLDTKIFSGLRNLEKICLNNTDLTIFQDVSGILEQLCSSTGSPKCKVYTSECQERTTTPLPTTTTTRSPKTTLITKPQPSFQSIIIYLINYLKILVIYLISKSK